MHTNDLVQYSAKYKVTAIETVTKTDKEYVWVIDDSNSSICDSILALPSPDPYFPHFQALYDCLDYHYRELLKKLKVNPMYTMKTIRCLYATEWVKKKTECEITGEQVPPNPLQHDVAATTEKYYALKGSNNVEQARKRISERRQVL